MPRLALIQAEIRQLAHDIHQLEEDNHFHPWNVDENAERIEKMRELLVAKRNMEHMLLTTPRSSAQAGAVGNFRQNADIEAKDISTVVYLLVVVAIVGIAVAMLMAAAGVLTQ